MNNTTEHYTTMDTKTIALHGDYKYLKQTLDEAVADVLSLHKQLEEAKEFIKYVSQPECYFYGSSKMMSKAKEVLERL